MDKEILKGRIPANSTERSTGHRVQGVSQSFYTKEQETSDSKTPTNFEYTADRATVAKKRAQKIVLKMIEDEIKPQFLKNEGRFINPEHYDDVVVERGISSLCGYPLCKNKFTDTFGKRTFIIRRNKVYDVAKRRNFCSNVCYEASELIRVQLSTAPLFIRDDETEDEIPPLRLPKLAKLRGMFGKLINIKGSAFEFDSDEELENFKSRKSSKVKKDTAGTVDEVAINSLMECSNNDQNAKPKQSSLNKTKLPSKNGSILVIDNNKDSKMETINEDKSTNEMEATSQDGCDKETKMGKENMITTDMEIINDGALSTELNTRNNVALSTELNTKNEVAVSTEIKTRNDVALSTEIKTINKSSLGLSTVIKTRNKNDSSTKNKQNDSIPQNPDDLIKDFKNLNLSSPSLQENDVQYEHCPLPSSESEVGQDKFKADIMDKIGDMYNDEREGVKSNTGDSFSSYAKDHDSNKKQSNKIYPLDYIHEVEQSMREWMTFESLREILGDVYVRGMLEHIGQMWEDFDTTAGMRLGVEAKCRYITLCKKLDREDDVDRRDEELIECIDTEDISQPKLPDYKQLKRDLEQQTSKVQAFLLGQDEYVVDKEQKNELSSINEDGTSKTSNNPGNDNNPNKLRIIERKRKKEIIDAEIENMTLPLIDSYSQNAWRRQLVHEKINTTLSDLMLLLNLSQDKVRHLLVTLVATFDLSPHNITFKPIQWLLITLILIKMFSVRYPIIATALEDEAVKNYITSILNGAGLDFHYLDRLLSYLTEIHYVLSKYHKKDSDKTKTSKSENATTKDECEASVLKNQVTSERDQSKISSQTSNYIRSNLTMDCDKETCIEELD